ncbi:TatD family hydrolase [bacterium]|nr:TatD family hydrolase [bacterium]
MIVDSHAHLGSPRFKDDLNQVIQRAFQKGIGAIFCPSEINDSQNIQVILQLIESHDNILAAAGVHPHSATEFNPDYSKKIKNLAEENQIKAVGEIGLDYHYNFSPLETQQKTFRQQLHLAQKLNLPVIIHSREAGKDVIKAVEEEKFTCGGILHCFTEDWNTAKKMMDLGFFISFSGILTYPGAHSLRETAKKIPLEKILVETDSPYLVPVPHRGKKKRNEPAFVKEVAKVLAAVKEIPLEELTERTTQNFKALFSFEIKKSR